MPNLISLLPTRVVRNPYTTPPESRRVVGFRTNQRTLWGYLTEDESAMKECLPVVYVARHGNTAWTHSGQHTGLTDLPLTPDGERNAQRLGERLKGMTFTQVFTSPLQRAMQTCRLSGYGTGAVTDPDLVEWDYGE